MSKSTHTKNNFPNADKIHVVLDIFNTPIGGLMAHGIYMAEGIMVFGGVQAIPGAIVRCSGRLLIF